MEIEKIIAINFSEALHGKAPVYIKTEDLKDIIPFFKYEDNRTHFPFKSQR